MNDGLSLPPLLGVPADDLTDPGRCSLFEWIEPDGEGGWAAGTAIGAATRREHGMLVVAHNGERLVLLSRFEETIVAPDGTRHAIGCNFYPGAVHPQGYRHLRGFSLDPWPVWRYVLGDRELVREVFRSRREGALIVRYRLDGAPAELEVRPLFAGRTVTSLVTANDLVERIAEASEGMVAYRPYADTPATVLTYLDGSWTPSPEWYYRNAYPHDGASNGSAREDLFSPGVLRLPLRPATATSIACGLRPARIGRVDRRLNDEISRREMLAARGRALAGGSSPLAELGARAALAADAFLPADGMTTAVPVTWPDGAIRTRDLLIALPWLARATGRTAEALAVLRALPGRLRDGALPYRLDPGSPGGHERAAVDTALWFVEAAGAFAGLGHEVDVLLPAVDAVIEAFLAGTGQGVRAGEDGLLVHGSEEHPLTWMDALAHGRPATPRHGRAIEVNALWYNALMRAAGLAADGDTASRRSGQAERVRNAFDAFWSHEARRPWDVLDPGSHHGRALRPNMLLAVSLPHAAFTGERARDIVAAVEGELLIPCGIRTLPPGAEDYRGRLDQTAAGRALHAHQGTAWPAWIGPYVRAALRAHGGDPAVRDRMRDLLLEFGDRLGHGALGHIEERCAGDPPHTADGNLASAWSLAGLIEALCALRAADAGESL